MTVSLSACTPAPAAQIVSYLSAPTSAAGGGCGLPYWGDWLDLQASGPVPWRREIEEGIESCAKARPPARGREPTRTTRTPPPTALIARAPVYQVVCFLDGQYLQSFNCLQEARRPADPPRRPRRARDTVCDAAPGDARGRAACAQVAYAIQYSKEVVPILLDQAGFEMLVKPQGHQLAWDGAPDGQGPAPLKSYEGQELVPGKPFTREARPATPPPSLPASLHPR